jgi:hypothetical protein
MEGRACSIVVGLALAMAACSGAGDGAGSSTTVPATTPTAPLTTTAIVPSTVPTSTVTTSTTPTTTAAAPAWSPPPVCEGACDPPIEVLFSLTVGDEIHYRNADRGEALPSGPTALAVTDEGRIWISDSTDLRLLGFEPDGTLFATVDLTQLEVGSPIDIAVGPAGLLLLDVYVAMERYRLLVLGEDGAVRAVHELPEGVHLQDGLTGVAAGPRGELWLELEAGARVAALDVSGPAVEFEITPGSEYPGGLYGPLPDNPFVFNAGDIQVDVSSAATIGGLSLVGVNPDGGFVLLLVEVYVDESGAFVVDHTVHLFDAAGNHQGMAVAPFTDQFIELDNPYTLGPDGYVYGLLTLPDRVDVVRLPFAA